MGPIGVGTMRMCSMQVPINDSETLPGRPCMPARNPWSRACRNLRPGEASLMADEQALLDRICEAYYLPAWCSVDDYRRIFEAQGLQVRSLRVSAPALLGCLLWPRCCFGCAGRSAPRLPGRKRAHAGWLLWLFLWVMGAVCGTGSAQQAHAYTGGVRVLGMCPDAFVVRAWQPSREQFLCMHVLLVCSQRPAADGDPLLWGRQ